MSKKKAKKRKNKKENHKKKVLISKNKSEQGFHFIEKIKEYKKWIPFGVLSFLIPFYISYYPEKLELTSEILGKRNQISNAIIFKNPNSYEIENINITNKGIIDILLTHESSMKDFKFKSTDFFTFIPAKESKHIIPNIGFITDTKLTEINKCYIEITYSYETPFFYPNVNETIHFKGYLKSDGEVVYIYN